MKERDLTLNGRELSRAQAQTFRMALDMANLNLQTLPVDKSLDGVAVAEHLRNLSEIIRFVRGYD